MNTRGRAIVGARFILVVALALVGAGFTTFPATAKDAPEVGAAGRSAASPSAAAWPMPTGGHAEATDQFVVKLKDKANTQSVDRQSPFSRLAGKSGLSLQVVRTTANGEDVLQADRRLDSGEAQEVAMGLAADPAVEYAEPDTIMRAFEFTAPSDPLSYYQWNHTYGGAGGGIGVLGAWNVSQGEGVNVAVVDSGITDHPDLKANILPGYDMISSAAAARDGNSRDADPHDKGDATAAGQCAAGEPAYPSSWHGTHVAGIIAAVPYNNIGMAGVAPKAKVVPVRAIGVCGGYMSDVVDSIIWAAGGTVSGVPANTNPARVINLSLGGKATCSVSYQNAIDFARSRGAAVVVAAGNENTAASYFSPANCKNVITVGAGDNQQSKAYYSNFGGAVDIIAPGGDMRLEPYQGIISTYNQGSSSPAGESYAFMQGTSMAAPHVAATLAMMLSADPVLTPDQAEAKIKATAQAVNACPSGCGSGLLNADRALREVADDALPIGTGTVEVLGTAVVGAELRSSVAGAWVNVPGVTWTYEWLRNGSPISGADGTEYFVQDQDLGAKIALRVTARKKRFDPVPITSVESTEVGFGNMGNHIRTSLEGHAFVGMTLTASAGEWWPTPATLSYQWLRDGQAIPGATGLNYTLVAADTGKKISFLVTATRPLYNTATSETETTPPVMPADHIVTPAAVSFVDRPYMGDDQYVIPSSVGVDYQIYGVNQAVGGHLGRGQMKIVAVAKADYLITPGATTEWSNFLTAKGPAFSAPAKSPFKDVLTTQQFYTEMAWMADRKISTGWVEADKSATYRPLTPINRDAMAAFLYRMAGSPAFTPPTKSPFKDVLTTQQFYKEMAWLAETGISTGWVEWDGSRRYQPLTPINRDAMAAFLYRLANSPDYQPPSSSPFIDVRPYHQFYAEMAWMAEKKISTGWREANGTYTYRALSPINRDAMAAFLYRMP